MKSLLTSVRTKKILFLLTLIISMLNISCSKNAGKTSSKLKIFSGNFSTVLSSKANNGLVLYGRSVDGKYSFSKKIDTDTVDLVFPNGGWNFYAVSWELTTAPAAGVLPNFTGKTYCGKASAVFDGLDATVQLNLTNPGCSDPAFSGEAKTVSGVVELPNVYIFTCKNISGINSVNNTACDQNLAVNFNKGYATSYRIVAFENQNFGAAPSAQPIAQSACIRSDFTTTTGMLNTADAAAANFTNLRIPTNFGNGFTLAAEVFYSEGAAGSRTPCDTTGGVDLVPLPGNAAPRVRTIVDTTPTISTYNFYIQSNEADVCRPPRLSPTNFAAGFGTEGSPYAVCTADQLALLRNNFSTYKDSSIDLLTDINYGLAHIAPIGDPLLAAGGNATNYYGKALASYKTVFNGKNHKISNFVIDCKTPAGTNDNNDVGFFRFIQDADIKNLTFNNAVIMCDSGNQIGALTGRIADTAGTTTLDNIRVHGHTEGTLKIGGVAGEVTGVGITAKGIHVKGDYDGSQYVGGLFGNMSMTSSSTISQVTFSGGISANHNTNGATVTTSWAGGILGYAGTTTGSIAIDQAIVKAERIEGSSTVGGFIGESSNVVLSDSYTESNLRVSGNTDGATTFANIGGAIGKAGGGSLTRVLATNGVKSSNRMTADKTLGGLVGNLGASAPTCTNSFFTGDHDASNPITACGIPALLTISNSRLQSSYTGFVFTPTANALWTMPDDTFDIPRLNFEVSIENAVSYLKRDCSGHYATQAGTGSALDPKWVCNFTQFSAMVPGTYYALKKNIVYDQTINGYTPLVAGAYLLNGNGYGLYNFSAIIPNPATSIYNFGIFSQLSSGSLISNLKIFGASFTGSITTPGSPFVTAHIGVLAGANYGTISNVDVHMSSATLTATTVAGDNLIFGGAVGLNAGLISQGEFDVRTKILDGSYPAGSVFSAAAGVGENSGTIQAVQNHSSIERDFTCATNSTVFNFSAQETIAGFVGVNDATGIIKEIESEGGFGSSITMTPGTGCTFTGTGGSISPFIANNLGTVQDFDVNPKYYFMSGGVIPAPELFANNLGGVSRGFVTIETADANKVMNQTHTLVSNWDAGANPFLVPATCTITSAGQYYDVIAASASTNVGPVAIGDIVMCDGTNNVLIPAAKKWGIMTPMSDVLYIVRSPTTTPPPLAAGRYYDNNLEFLQGLGLRVDTIAPVANVFDHSGWTVAIDFFNPGTNVWQLDLTNGATFTTKTPKLVKTGGGLDQLGLPF